MACREYQDRTYTAPPQHWGYESLGRGPILAQVLDRVKVFLVQYMAGYSRLAFDDAKS